MKIAAKILAILAIMFSIAGEVEAAEFDFAGHRRFILPIEIPRRSARPPQKFYEPRIPPARPKPHYIIPGKPKSSRDIRGGKRKEFGPPQAPFK